MASKKQNKNKAEGVNVPQWYLEIEHKLLKYISEQKELEEKIKAIRTTVYNLMTDEGIDTIDSGLTIVLMCKPYDSETIDKSKLKEELPDIYKKYVKTKHNQGYVTIKLINKE